MANIIVSGAGSTEVNGTYVESGEEGGKQLYANNANSDIVIGWDSSGVWAIGTSDYVTAYYYSSDDVATPDLCTTWEVYEGEPPVPTVTAVSSGQNLTLTCAAGSYSLTGTNVTLTSTVKRNLTLACNAGTYSLTGTNADLTVKRNYVLTCGAGSYSLTGTNADFYRALVMACEAGSYALTGTDASLTSHRIFALGMGSYVLVGTACGLFILSPTPACRTAIIEFENRTFAIPHENRTLEVTCH